MNRAAFLHAPAAACAAALLLVRAGGAATPDDPLPQHHTGDTYADNRYVHQWIALEAFRYFTNRIDGADLAAHVGSLPGSFADGDNTLLEGTRDEDVAGENPESFLSAYYWFPYLEHFCAGADGAELDDGLGSSPAAVSRATWYWDNYARPRYAGNRASSFYYLGHVAHLLADLTIPAHVHNDEHVSGDPYEDAVAVDGGFKAWSFGCTQNGLAAVWARPLRADHADLRALFRVTADYTEDYDSLDVDGDVTSGSAPCDPGDYPLDWHLPQAVSRAGGMDATELAVTANDLLPHAIRRVADLYRLFYRAVDATPPMVALLQPGTADPGNPERRGTQAPVLLLATAADGESGVVREGFRFAWRRRGADGVWSVWQPLTAAASGAAVLFTPPEVDVLYAVRVEAENGGGALAASGERYFEVRPPVSPRLQVVAADATRCVLAWGSSSGELYTVQQRGTLVTGTSWEPVGASLPATPPLNTHTDALGGVRQRFYRVQATLPGE